MLRFLLALVLVAAFASPALADATSPGTRLDRPRLLFDAGCTDSFDVPAVTVTTDILVETNWDTIAEAVNPDQNLGDAVQTSGSADGWCDATPWVISGTRITAGDEDLYIGPLILPRGGVYGNLRVGGTPGLDIVPVFRFNPPWSSPSTDIHSSITPIAAASTVLWYYGPDDDDNWTNSNMVAAASAPFGGGQSMYLHVNIDGAATWVFDLAWYPVVLP